MVDVFSIKAALLTGDSKFETNYPAIESFTDATDLLLPANLKGIAVTMTAHRQPINDEITYKHESSSFVLSIIDLDDHKRVVAQTAFCVHLSYWVHSDKPRIDVPLKPGDLIAGHRYRIEVARRNQKNPITRSTFKIFPDIDYASLLSVKSAYFVKKSFMDDSIDETKRYRQLLTINHGPHYTPYLHFDVECLGDRNLLPDLEIRFKDGDHEPVYEPTFKLENDGSPIYRFSAHSAIVTEKPIYAEICVFDTPLAGVVLSTGEIEIEGEYDDPVEDLCLRPFYSSFEGERTLNTRMETNPAFDAEMAKADSRLKSLVGLEAVKTKLKEYECLARFTINRQHLGLGGFLPPMHALFLGSPGTGKTTVAKIMGKLMKKAGMLSKGHVVIRERSTLTGEMYSSQSELTLAAIEEAQGGILFIDEAYQLYRPDDKRDPGMMVIDTLMTALADESKRDWMLILAGYTKPMMAMMETNPGLKSRIPEQNRYQFEDYTPSELCEIGRRYMHDNNYVLTPEADKAMCDNLLSLYANRDATFGNGREVMNLLQTQVIPSMAKRLYAIENPTVDDLKLVLPSDFPTPAPVHSARASLGFRA